MWSLSACRHSTLSELSPCARHSSSRHTFAILTRAHPLTGALVSPALVSPAPQTRGRCATVAAPSESCLPSAIWRALDLVFDAAPTALPPHRPTACARQRVGGPRWMPRTRSRSGQLAFRPDCSGRQPHQSSVPELLTVLNPNASLNCCSPLRTTDSKAWRMLSSPCCSH